MLEGRSLQEKESQDIPTHKTYNLWITFIVILVNVFDGGWLNMKNEHVFPLLFLNVFFLGVECPFLKLFVAAGYFLNDFFWVFAAIFYLLDLFGL